MLELFDTYAALFKSWRVIRYEQEGEAYLLYWRMLTEVPLRNRRMRTGGNADEI